MKTRDGIRDFLGLESDALRAWVKALDYLGASRQTSPSDSTAEDPMQSVTVEDAMLLADADVAEDEDSSSVASLLSSGGRAVLTIGGRLVIPAPLRILLTLLGSGVILGAGCLLLHLFYTALSSVASRLGIGGSTGASSIGASGVGAVPAGGMAPVTGVLSRTALGESLFTGLVGRSAPEGFLTSDFGATESFRGKAHGGVDFAMPEGTALHWPFAVKGRVTRIWNDTTYGGGLSMQITDARGGVWGFAHLSDNTIVSEGDEVSEGTLFALSGSTGHSTGPHLHLSYRSHAGAQREDPLSAYTALSGTKESVAVGLPTSGGFRGGDLIAEGNPMNLQYGGFSWEGSTGVTDASMGRRFVTFSSPLYGIRAGAKLLRNYQTRKDISGLRGEGIRLSDIGKLFVGGSLSGEEVYAGDDIDVWVSNVSQLSGFGEDEIIDLRDSDVLSRVVRAVSQQESGSRVSEEYADTAVSMLSGTVEAAHNEQLMDGGLNVQRL